MWAKNIQEVLPLERKARWNVPSCMVWAGVGHGYKTELIILPSKKKDADGEARVFRLNAEQYIRRCLQPVVGSLLAKKRILQQDGARSHIAKRTIQYLKNKKLEVVSDWPPYSPDLNCVERLWKELNHRVGRRCPMTQEELQRFAKEEWAAIPQTLINRHVAHFEKQIRSM
jgi:transposase